MVGDERMALEAAALFGLGQVLFELGDPGGAARRLEEARVRRLAGAPEGAPATGSEALTELARNGWGFPALAMEARLAHLEASGAGRGPSPEAALKLAGREGTRVRGAIRRSSARVDRLGPVRARHAGRPGRGTSVARSHVR